MAVAEICIIGAGSSGMVVAKALRESGLGYDCFEKGSDIGGMWRYENDNGLSSAYASLHIDTSRENLGYSDFPIADDQPDFLSHDAFLRHLEAYADHFDLRRGVSFNTSVEQVERDGERWKVRLSSGDTRHYRAVVVANGHLSDPRWPQFPGTFAGDVSHSHHYRTAARFEAKDVLVVGLGNSAVDIAVDLCRRAHSVSISTRRSAWIMPKYLMGIPIDRWSAFLSRRLRLSTRLTRMLMARLIRLAIGDQRRFGVRRPEHPMWREHATLSQDLLPAIGHGRITIKPDIAELAGEDIVFADGSRRRFDAVIYATGYRTSFPFLGTEIVGACAEAPALYRRISSVEHPGLFFAGLVQPIGPTIPLVEIQANWIAAVLSRALALPPPDRQRKEIAAHREEQRRTYLDTARYALEVDFKSYASALRGDLAAETLARPQTGRERSTGGER
jgi:cation diffusion facilitator CzcD-associated flavoprotein CzcO